MELQMGATDSLWQHCVNTVQTLRIAMRDKNFYDPAVRSIRLQLRVAYEAFLLQDYNSAQDKQIEQSLWKLVVYAVIEEFRRRIKATIAGGEKQRELYTKVRDACLRFLNEASLFYALLVLKLQAAYGSVGFELDYADKSALDTALGSVLLPPRVATLDCRISVYRCLICLGDLARYETMIEGGQDKKDWSKAEKYYRQAVNVFPEGGNSFNQLAVLATYSEAHLPAVYYYYRSLAVAQPFQVARENLLLLFEQNRVQYEQLGGSSGQGGGGRAPGRGRGRHRGPAAQQQQKPRVPIAALLPKLCTRFVRMHGVLFTKINMDTFGDVLAGAFADLDDLLGRAPVARGGNGDARKSDELLMQLTAMCMFVAWNISYVPPDHRPGYSEVLQRAELKRHVLALAYGYAAALTYAVACVGDMRNSGATPLASPLLGPMNVLLQWLATQPDYVRPEDMDEAEAKERTALWRALAKLLLLLPPPLLDASPAALPEDWQLRAFAPLNAAHSRLDFQQAPSDQETARLRLHRILVAIHGIAQHHPASLAAAADAAQPAHAQEEHAAAAELHRAVQRVVSEAQTGVEEAAVAAHDPASTSAHDNMQDGANGGGKPDAGLGFVSEDEEEEVILYQPGGAAKEHPAPVPAHAAIHASTTSMDISPQRGLNAGVSHEISELPASATVAGNDAGKEISADPFSIYAGAHGPHTTPHQQSASPSRHPGVSTANMPGPMAEADLANGQGTAAAGTTGPPDTEGFVDGGGRGPSVADSQQLGATTASERRPAPPPMILPGDDGWVSGYTWVSGSTLQAQEFGHPAAGTSSAGMPHGSSATGAVFSGPALGISGGFAQLYWQEQQQQEQQQQEQQQQEQQQREQEQEQQRFPQPQPYAGAAAVAPPASNLPQPSSSFASGSFSRRGSPAAPTPPASSMPTSVSPSSQPLATSATHHESTLQEQQEPAAPGAAQQGTPSSAQQLLSGLLGGPDRQSAQLPPGQQNYGQGAGGFGAAPPAPPLPSGLPLESRLFTNPDAGGAGALFSRDLFATQREGLSRPNSMMSIADGHVAAGAQLDSRPVSRNSVGHLSVRSQADTDAGRATPQPGMFGAAQQHGHIPQQDLAMAGPATFSAHMAGSTYGTAEQQHQQQQQQQQAVQSSWLKSSGFYMGGDRRPQPPPQPSGLGFYTRDSQTLEAQLVAQAYQNQQGGTPTAAMNTAGFNTNMMNTNNAGGLNARDSVQAYLDARPVTAAEQLSEPAAHLPGGAGWLAAGLGAGGTGAGGYGYQPGMQHFGYGAQPQSPWSPPAPTGGLFGTPNGAVAGASAFGLGQGAGSVQSFPQQRAADQTGGGLMLRSTSAQPSCLSGMLPGLDQQQQFNNHQDHQQQVQQGLPLMQQQFQINQDPQQQQPQQQQSLASMTNAELQQRLAMMSGGGGLGQGWASGGPSVSAGMFGVGVTASIGPQVGSSLDLQALPGGALKQGGDQLAGLEGQAAAYQGSAAPNGNAGWSWLDAFEARQKALAAQAAGPGASPFPFPGAGTAGSSFNISNIYGV
ncbi:probable telomerase-binding protein EST1A at N-terminal half [Coccomyxa sp. Obi]|nr:probable telomerase-binding protein EST1A at N-terminal half [Coccomyxa sp. Obi]